MLAFELAQDDGSEDTGVDIAAAQDEADLAAAEMSRISKHRGEACRTRTFSKRLLVGQIGHDGALDVALPDKAHIIDILLGNGDGALGHILDGDALGERGAAAFGGLAAQSMIHRGVELHLDTQDLDAGPDMLGGDRRAADDTAAADRHDDAVEIGRIFEHFDADGALPGYDHVVVIRVDEQEAFFLDQRLGGQLAVGERLARQDDICPMGARALDFGRWRRLRHHDRGGNGESFCVIGNRLRMVAGRHGNDAARLFGRSEARHLVIGTAVLE